MTGKNTNNIYMNNKQPNEPDFNTLKNSLSEKIKKRTELLKQLSILKKEINNDKKEIYKKCTHSYIKTFENEGCYSQTYYRCIHCGKLN